MKVKLRQKLKTTIKNKGINKGLKIILALLITYGPGGVLGKLLKIIGSKWVIHFVTKKITR